MEAASSYSSASRLGTRFWGAFGGVSRRESRGHMLVAMAKACRAHLTDADLPRSRALLGRKQRKHQPSMHAPQGGPARTAHLQPRSTAHGAPGAPPPTTSGVPRSSRAKGTRTSGAAEGPRPDCPASVPDCPDCPGSGASSWPSTQTRKSRIGRQRSSNAETACPASVSRSRTCRQPCAAGRQARRSGGATARARGAGAWSAGRNRVPRAPVRRSRGARPLPPLPRRNRRYRRHPKKPPEEACSSDKKPAQKWKATAGTRAPCAPAPWRSCRRRPPQKGKPPRAPPARAIPGRAFRGGRRRGAQVFGTRGAAERLGPARRRRLSKTSTLSIQNAGVLSCNSASCRTGRLPWSHLAPLPPPHPKPKSARLPPTPHPPHERVRPRLARRCRRRAQNELRPRGGARQIDVDGGGRARGDGDRPRAELVQLQQHALARGAAVFFFREPR